MKRIRSLTPMLLALPLSLGLVACDLEKEDGADTGANVDDMDEDEMDDDEEPGDDEDPGSSSAGTGVDPGDDEDEGGSSDSGVDPEDTGDTDDGETGEDPGDGEANGIAMLHGEIPDIDPGESGDSGDSGGSGGSGGDGGIPEDAVLVVLSNDGAATCEEPWAGSECGGNWTISFTLMPDMLQPGSYNLFEEANGGFSYGFEPHPEGDCAWGGGSLDGTLVIESVDDDAVIGHIEDSDAFDFDANVSFVAPRC